MYSFEWKLKSKKSELAFEYGICKLEKSRQNFNSNNEYIYCKLSSNIFLKIVISMPKNFNMI